MLLPLFLIVAASSCLMSLATLGVRSRAKTTATGFVPLAQYRQFFLPAWSPLMFSGWNGPGTSWPTCGPDFTPLWAWTPRTATRLRTLADRIVRRIIGMHSSRKRKRPRPRRKAVGLHAALGFRTANGLGRTRRRADSPESGEA